MHARRHTGKKDTSFQRENVTKSPKSCPISSGIDAFMWRTQTFGQEAMKSKRPK